jgi:hypothetical protein
MDPVVLKVILDDVDAIEEVYRVEVHEDVALADRDWLEVDPDWDSLSESDSDVEEGKLALALGVPLEAMGKIPMEGVALVVELSCPKATSALNILATTTTTRKELIWNCIFVIC